MNNLKHVDNRNVSTSTISPFTFPLSENTNPGLKYMGSPLGREDLSRTVGTVASEVVSRTWTTCVIWRESGREETEGEEERILAVWTVVAIFMVIVQNQGGRGLVVCVPVTNNSRVLTSFFQVRYLPQWAPGTDFLRQADEGDHKFWRDTMCLLMDSFGIGSVTKHDKRPSALNLCDLF